MLLNIMYEIRSIPLFDDVFSKIIHLNKQDDFKRRILKLSENPYAGKPLGYKYLREIKLDKFRVYYMVFDKEVIVLLITVSDKKTQKKTIDFIKQNTHLFKEIVKNINNKGVM